MNEGEWKERYKARFESRMGLECGPEFLESAWSLDPTDKNPEAAVDDEISLWGEP